MVHNRARTKSIHFDSRGESKFFLIFIHVDESLYFLFWFILILYSFGLFIHFYLRFDLILFILIRLDFDSSQITIHSWIMIHLRIKDQIESKTKGRWIVIHLFANHWLIRFRIKSESKWIANQAGSSPVVQNIPQTVDQISKLKTRRKLE